MVDVLIGFDSAWTDRTPGAICAAAFDGKTAVSFEAPRLAHFDDAAGFIEQVRSPDGVTILALDQPTVVKNPTSMRPVERVAATLVSWLGGGVQPANRGKVGMFCDAAPIWPFLDGINAAVDPEAARTATAGLHVMEVFPALALPSLHTGFFGRHSAPKYNPARRKTYRLPDWQLVAQVAADRFTGFGCDEAATWCAERAACTKPKKADQDQLDAMLCLLVAMMWRFAAREESMMLGTVADGYMVFPASPEVRERISTAADRLSVPCR